MVYVSKTVSIQGGYSAAFADPPDPDINPAVLDAQGQGRVLYIAGDIHPTIAGLHLCGGDATGLGGRDHSDAGGGVYVMGATLTLSDNLIAENTASSTGYGHGGGVHLASSHAILNANTIRDNIASRADDGYGGGIEVYQSNTTFNGNAILSNTASLKASFEGVGGGVAMLRSGGILADNTIQGNIANGYGGAFGGGVYLQSDSPITLSGNLIQNNIASRAGSRYDNG
jgi:hypothetical protein